MDTPAYEQLALWEHDGELFAEPAEKWTEGQLEDFGAVVTAVPVTDAAHWNAVAKLAALRQQEIARYYDLASSASDLAPSFTD